MSDLTRRDPNELPAADEPGRAEAQSGSPPAGLLWVIALTLYLFAVAAGALWMLLEYSPIPDLLGGNGTATPSGKPPTDWQVLHIVIAMGALGSIVHAATSLADYVGNRALVRSWLLWFVMRPVVGVALAVIFFFVLRVGFAQPSATDGGTVSALNPIAVAAFSGLVGMFAKQAVDKLAEVFDTLFEGRQDEGRKDKLPESKAAPAAAQPAAPPEPVEAKPVARAQPSLG